MPTQATITPKKSRQQWARELRQDVADINSLQHRTLERLLAFGKKLAQAKADVGHGGFLKLLADLKIDVRQAQRAIKVAHDPRVSNAANSPHLPSTISALVLLLRLTDDVFNAALESGAITKDMTAAAAKALTVRIGEVPSGEVGWLPKKEPGPLPPTPPRMEIDRANALVGKAVRQYQRLAEIGLIDGGELATALAGFDQARGVLPRLIEPEPSGAEVVPLHPGSSGAAQPTP